MFPVSFHAELKELFETAEGKPGSNLIAAHAFLSDQYVVSITTAASTGADAGLAGRITALQQLTEVAEFGFDALRLAVHSWQRLNRTIHPGKQHHLWDKTAMGAEVEPTPGVLTRIRSQMAVSVHPHESSKTLAELAAFYYHLALLSSPSDRDSTQRLIRVASKGETADDGGWKSFALHALIFDAWMEALEMIEAHNTVAKNRDHRSDKPRSKTTDGIEGQGAMSDVTAVSVADMTAGRHGSKGELQVLLEMAQMTLVAEQSIDDWLHDTTRPAEKEYTQLLSDTIQCVVVPSNCDAGAEELRSYVAVWRNALHTTLNAQSFTNHMPSLTLPSGFTIPAASEPMVAPEWHRSCHSEAIMGKLRSLVVDARDHLSGALKKLYEDAMNLSVAAQLSAFDSNSSQLRDSLRRYSRLQPLDQKTTHASTNWEAEHVMLVAEINAAHEAFQSILDAWRLLCATFRPEDSHTDTSHTIVNETDLEAWSARVKTHLHRIDVSRKSQGSSGMDFQPIVAVSAEFTAEIAVCSYTIAKHLLNDDIDMNVAKTILAASRVTREKEATSDKEHKDNELAYRLRALRLMHKAMNSTINVRLEVMLFESGVTDGPRERPDDQAKGGR